MKIWDSVYISPLSLSRKSFPFIKNCVTCLIRGRKSIRVTQSFLLVTTTLTSKAGFALALWALIWAQILASKAKVGKKKMHRVWLRRKPRVQIGTLEASVNPALSASLKFLRRVKVNLGDVWKNVLNSNSICDDLNRKVQSKWIPVKWSHAILWLVAEVL